MEGEPSSLKRVKQLPDVVQVSCHPRVGIIGNPSDGYAGKTIGCTFTNYRATINMQLGSKVKFDFNPIGDPNVFDSIDSLVSSINRHGYDGGLRLLMATTKMFHVALKEENIVLPREAYRGFTMSYTTNVPRQLGLAGSSAICTAVFRSLIQWHGLDANIIPPSRLANYVLRAEQEELGITAGLQDRVCQVFDELVFMDFTPDAFKQHNNQHGHYVPLGGKATQFLDGRLFLLTPGSSFGAEIGKSSGKIHSPIRSLWEKNDPFVRSTMLEIAQLAEDGRIALIKENADQFAQLMNNNFALRLKLFGEAVSKRDIALIELAKSVNGRVGAKLPGSGGAVLVFSPEPDGFQSQIEGTKQDVHVLRLKLSPAKVVE